MFGVDPLTDKQASGQVLWAGHRASVFSIAIHSLRTWMFGMFGIDPLTDKQGSAVGMPSRIGRVLV